MNMQSIEVLCVCVQIHRLGHVQRRLDSSMLCLAFLDVVVGLTLLMQQLYIYSYSGHRTCACYSMKLHWLCKKESHVINTMQLKST